MEDGLQESQHFLFGFVPHGGRGIDASDAVGSLHSLGRCRRRFRADGYRFVVLSHVRVGDTVPFKFDLLRFYITFIVSPPVHSQGLIDKQRTVERVDKQLLRAGQTFAFRRPYVQRDPRLRQ